MKVKNKVDNGNARENKGKAEKCNESTLAYYRGLYDNSPEARQIKVEIFSNLSDYLNRCLLFLRNWLGKGKHLFK